MARKEADWTLSLISRYSPKFLEEVYVAEVVSKTYSRHEYTALKRIPYNVQLWKNDPKRPIDWRWARVFKFRPLAEIGRKRAMTDLAKKLMTRDFVEAVVQAFCFRKSRQIDQRTYTCTLEPMWAFMELRQRG